MIKKIFYCIPFIFGLFFILFFWKNTILHLNTQIHDWYDGAFIIWTMQNNIRHFQSLDFIHLFETNAMYPFTNSLSFTDHLFVPSFLAFIISFFNSNPLFQFNILSVVNHILVFISFYLLASRFTKNNWIKSMAAIYGSFGPYFFSQFGHFQMLFMWPLVMSMYYLLSPQRRIKELILIGVFLVIQFLTGVYLGLIGLTMVGLYFISILLTNIQIINYKLQFNDKFRITKWMQNIGLILLFFIIISAPSLYGYIKINTEYKPTRDQSEFVTYSAHATDYVLVMFTNSWFNRIIFQPLIGKYNQHTRGELAGFVGVIPLAVSGWWLAISMKRKKKLVIRPINEQHDKVLIIWLILLIIIGFVFSLGPRMNWNGTYLVTPLPYWLVMKLFPPIAIMRAVSRWYFMVVFAILIGMTLGMDMLINRYKKFSRIIITILLISIFLEFYPAPLSTSSKNWKSDSYLFLQKICKQDPKPILEYPFEYRDRATDIGKYLSLKTNTLMSSTLHNCPTLSGFSSFEPPLFKKWQEDFDTNGITNTNLKILKENKFGFVKINLDALSKGEKLNPQSVIHTTDLKELFRDTNSIIYKIIN